MKTEKIRAKLDREELPDNFTYPASFDTYLEHRAFENELEPWGITANVESDAMYSDEYGRPLVKFAQAWGEDMIASFLADTGKDPRVVVFNPWADTFADGGWNQTMHVLEVLPNFSAWLAWSRNSEVVRQYAEVRDDRERQEQMI